LEKASGIEIERAHLPLHNSSKQICHLGREEKIWNPLREASEDCLVTI
jgi:hypothetical protein